MDRKTLRKLEYPNCARECLTKIENIITNRTKQDSTMDHLISEFVFCERSKDSERKSSSLTLIQEFQLIVVLSEFFSRPGFSETTRNAVFLCLFNGSISKLRLSVLVKLISTSVSCSISPLLCASGTWMQQLGATSPPSLQLAQNLVTDFVVFSRKSSEQLNSIPMLAPSFAANFMTAVTELYFNDSNDNTPPDILLEVFTEWVTDNPSLCLASQQSLANLSPVGVTPIMTPLAGLIRWCVLAPICNDRKETYSKLHLAILQSLLQTNNAAGPSTTLNPQHLTLIVNLLHLKIDELAKLNIDLENDERVQTSLERFAQAIQIAFSARCFYGSSNQLLARLAALPHNTLLQLVIKANKRHNS